MATTERSYFDVIENVVLPNGDVFRTYRAGNAGPHVVLLHGGGYASTTWCLVAEAMKDNVIVHAIDMRGHGGTQTANEGDISIGTLVEDIVQVLAQILPRDEQCVLVGHSLGGAVAVRVAASERLPSLVGVMVIDVVEGTALASLDHMDRILAKRPQSFQSIEDAVHWALHTGTVRNAEAAALSIPSQLRQTSGGEWNWRTDLKHSAPYWRDWFLGLSEQFLSLKVAKILVLAGSDRLDTTLMRGQMMGKFELRVVYGAGHIIQEDCPDQVSNAILEFCGRCARIITVNRCGLQGFNPLGPAKMPTSTNELLASRLAKARAMTPNVGTEVMPPQAPQ